MKRIRTLQALKNAADARKAVVIPKYWGWSKPRPAAFMFNLQGPVLLRLFESGMFIYERPKAE